MKGRGYRFRQPKGAAINFLAAQNAIMNTAADNRVRLAMQAKSNSRATGFTLSRILAFTILALLSLQTIVATAAPVSDAISVSGTTILKGGKPWVPKGVVVDGLVVPAGAARGAYIGVRARFGENELDAISNFGADLIRFQVSQAGAAPQSNIYSSAYVDEVVRGVHMARAHGFAVILSMQSGRASGVDDPRGLPNDETMRAWRNLAPRFAGDSGVMLELFNEPSRPKHRGGGGQEPSWAEWRDAHQPIIDEIRREGIHNVLIVDGLKFAKTLNGARGLSDPDASLIYAVHPYPQAHYSSEADWDEAFGDFAKTHPVLATEWNVRVKGYCDPGFPEVAASFLAYAKSHKIGVVGWSFDFPNTLFDSFGALTSYKNFSCSSEGTWGVGELLHGYFLKN